METTLVSSFEEESTSFASGAENPFITEGKEFGVDGGI